MRSGWVVGYCDAPTLGIGRHSQQLWVGGAGCGLLKNCYGDGDQKEGTKEVDILRQGGEFDVVLIRDFVLEGKEPNR